MKIFISGATGFIGSKLTLRLAAMGHQVHALYRDERKASIIRHPNVSLFKGDVLNCESILQAMEGCEQAYHAAAFARVWQQDHMQIYRQNIEGSMNVARAAIKAGVKRMVFTSTGGVLGYSKNGCNCDETTELPNQYFIDYECSKRIMEESLLTLATGGMDIVIVSPTRVYGPGVLSESNGITRIMQKYLTGSWRIIPGNGLSVGNYVFIDDVVTGHIEAMNKGRSGEKYVLGGVNLSYNEFFKQLSEITSLKYRMVHLPVPVSEFAAGILLAIAKVTGKSPLITPALIRKYYHNWSVSSSKAMKELDYNPVDFKTGGALTIDWLKRNSN